MTAAYRSPITGAPLAPEGDALLRDGDGRLWPVLDGIPFLRVGREALAAAAVAHLQAGDREAALLVLLADQDDWWTGAKPDPADLRRLVRDRDHLNLREAMACLAFDRVGDYFAHRWSDPTFLAGLALLDAHWREPTRTAFELACGIGHYGRELARRGVAYTGGDVVFAKLWLARHWVLPDTADLVCFDAAAPWPVADRRLDLVFCHDAFYFLDPKPAIRDRLQALAGPNGRIAVSHIHNSGATNLSSGHAVSVDDIATLFPGATVYDDAELTYAFVAGRTPDPGVLKALGRVEAFAVEAGALKAGVPSGRPVVPVEPSRLRLNPLYVETDAGWHVAWPSPRYEAEYAPRATFPPSLDRRIGERLLHAAQHEPGRDDALVADAFRRRILVDLPERW